MKIIYLLFFMLIPIFILPVYATESTDNTSTLAIFVQSDKDHYVNGDVITISGKITNYDSASGKFFSFIVLSPDNNIMTLGQGSPSSDGSFEKSFVVGGPLWKLAGDYEIEIQYDDVYDQITINYVGGEFVGSTPEACVGCSMEEARAMANEELPDNIPVSVWTDKTEYIHNDMILVDGQVGDVSGFPVTLTVLSPLNSLVTHDQLTVTNDGSFETTLNTAGAMWKYDGTYTIKVNYGSPEKSNSVKVELTGGVAFTPNYSTPTRTSIIIQTDDDHYYEGDTIVISGNVSTKIGETPVIIQIFHEGSTIEVAQITVAQYGSFTKTILAEKPQLEEPGEYIVRAFYQDQVAETEFTFSPKVYIIMEKTTYRFGDMLSYTIVVSEITGEPAIIHIRDETGKVSSAIPIQITNLQTTVPSLVTFNEDVWPAGKYFIEVNYSGGSDISEFTLIDLISTPKPKISNDYPIIGNPDAPITIIEYSDFQCPFCARFYTQTLPSIFEEYIEPGKVKLIFKNYPIESIHPNALSAALAAECAHDQGKFKEMHDMLFDYQNEWNRQDTSDALSMFSQYASEIQLEQHTFDICLSKKNLDEIRSYVRSERSSIVSGTPAFFIGHEEMEYVELKGAQPFESFKKIIDSISISETKPFCSSGTLYDLSKNECILNSTEEIKSSKNVPDWVKKIFGWYAQDQVSEEELVEAIKYLIDEKILTIN